MADDVPPPVRRRRPSKGAYGEPATETVGAPEPGDAVPTAPFRPRLP
jgi:hypothetical protein